MFINQQGFFTTTDKDIRFRGLVPLTNRTKEERYRALDIVTRHLKNQDFPLNTFNATASLNQLWMK